MEVVSCLAHEHRHNCSQKTGGPGFMSVCLCRSRLANLVRALTKLELESGRPRALRQDMPQDLRIAALLGEDCNRESLVCRRDSADPTLVFMLKKTQPVCESQHLEQVGSRASNHALSLQVHVQLLFPRVARPGIDGCHLSRCVDQDPQSHCTEPCAEPAKIARVSIGLTWSAPKLLTLSYTSTILPVRLAVGPFLSEN